MFTHLLRLSLIGLLFFACSSYSLAANVGEDFHATHYALDLTPNLADKSVRGVENITIAMERKDTESLIFSGNALTIDSATINGKPIPFLFSRERIAFTLPHEMALSKTATLRVVFHGRPVSGLTFLKDSAFTSYDACGWMICLEDTPGNKATFSLDLHIPSGMRSLAIGRLVGKTVNPDGSEVHHWQSSRPYSAYLFDFAFGHYTVVRAGRHHARLVYLSDTKLASELQSTFGETDEMVKFLSKRAGLGLPLGEYAQLLVAGDEAQEAATYSILGADNIDPKDDWAIAHELAHQWWGNLVTCATWKDFWLNEGITVYMTAAWKEHQYGHAAYEAEMNVSRKRFDAVRKKGWDKPLAYGGEYPSIGVRRAIQYSKGAIFMEQLRQQLGDRAFWAGLRLYTREHAGGTVTSIDLEQAMEKASGRDLSGLFAEWVFGK